MTTAFKAMKNEVFSSYQHQSWWWSLIPEISIQIIPYAISCGLPSYLPDNLCPQVQIILATSQSFVNLV
jgi:hypothetical protein